MYCIYSLYNGRVIGVFAHWDSVERVAARIDMQFYGVTVVTATW